MAGRVRQDLHDGRPKAPLVFSAGWALFHMTTTITRSVSPRKELSAFSALVVDDDPFQLEVNSDLLKSLGIGDVSTAVSGSLALQAITKSKSRSGFDLMLIDLYMPEMDGFQFMAAAAQAGFAGHLLIVSGQSTEVLHSASLVAQLRRFKLLGTVQKPVDRSLLSDLLFKIA